MVQKFFNLFTHNVIVFVILMIITGITVELGLDARIGMLGVGLTFGCSGIGQVMKANQVSDQPWRKGLGGCLILFCLLTIVVMLMMFLMGETLNV